MEATRPRLSQRRPRSLTRKNTESAGAGPAATSHTRRHRWPASRPPQAGGSAAAGMGKAGETARAAAAQAEAAQDPGPSRAQLPAPSPSRACIRLAALSVQLMVPSALRVRLECDLW